MAIPSAPTNLSAQQGNLHAYILWDISAGATSYSVQRSTDGVNYTNLVSAPTNSYLDTTVVVGTQYWYQVASTNVSGTSTYCAPQSVIPSANSELSLKELRQRSKEKADRVNSNFVTLSEWNFFINQALYELYDTLIDTYEDYFEAPEITFQCNGTDYLYPIPDGVKTFADFQGNTIIAPPLYRLSGLDLGLNTANNAFVAVTKYNLIDRNLFVYPNSSSTIYGVFNLQYRLMGNNIRFIPTPSAGQFIRLLYVPKLPVLLQETDMSTIGYSGWLQYVIVRAAKYALDKEESDTSKLDTELAFLTQRITSSAINRDIGRPDTISDSRTGNWSDGWGGGSNGSIGGW